MINLTESISSLPSHLTHPWDFGRAGLFCERSPPRAPQPAPTTAPFCESQQDMKQVEDALRSEDAMDEPLQDGVLESQGRAMLQPMMQTHIDPRRRRSPASRSGMARPSSVPTSDETLGW